MEIPEIALIVAEELFKDQKSIAIGKDIYEIKILSKTGLHAADIGDCRFIEQNQAKSSQWARMAREGSKIVWVFRKGKYYARVVDGQYTCMWPGDMWEKYISAHGGKGRKCKK